MASAAEHQIHPGQLHRWRHSGSRPGRRSGAVTNRSKQHHDAESHDPQ